MYGRVDVIRFLIQAGADPEATGAVDCSVPINLALIRGHSEAVRILLAPLGNKTTIAGFFPMHVAAVQGSLGILQTLVAAGAEIDKPCCEDGWTALHVAANNGQVEAVRFLLQAGAEPDLTTKSDGLTALNLADLKGYAEVAQVLIENGARRNKARRCQ